MYVPIGHAAHAFEDSEYPYGQVGITKQSSAVVDATGDENPGLQFVQVDAAAAEYEPALHMPHMLLLMSPLIVPVQ
jgi:hypothetical protein